ncbi:MAG: hypothetical protein PSN46_05415 [Gammaproteobacteria bacterium]|nr:hypothetical protein [Gammaproteobacteria bacterium]
MLSRAQFFLKPSYYLASAAAVVWVIFTGCGVGLAGWSWLALGNGLLTGMIIGLWARHYVWLKSDTSVVAMSWTVDDYCCYLKNGDQVSGTILAKSAFNPYFITLHLARPDGGKFWWPLMADSGPENTLRRLRVFGRWHKQNPIANQN